VVEPPDHVEVLEAGEVLVNSGVLPGHADQPAQSIRVTHDVEPGDARPTAVGREQRRQHPHGRRLARAVRAEQAHHRALRHLEVEPVERAHLSVPLGQCFSDDRCHPVTPVPAFLTL
jgi:hypothetical protein